MVNKQAYSKQQNECFNDLLQVYWLLTNWKHDISFKLDEGEKVTATKKEKLVAAVSLITRASLDLGISSDDVVNGANKMFQQDQIPTITGKNILDAMVELRSGQAGIDWNSLTDKEKDNLLFDGNAINEILRRSNKNG